MRSMSFSGSRVELRARLISWRMASRLSSFGPVSLTVFTGGLELAPSEVKVVATSEPLGALIFDFVDIRCSPYCAGPQRASSLSFMLPLCQHVVLEVNRIARKGSPTDQRQGKRGGGERP